MLSSKEKHIFVLSESGKPIYSLHGEEGMLVTLVGPMLALVSVVADGGDTIKSIKSADTNIVFLVKSPLILVGVSSNSLGQYSIFCVCLMVFSEVKIFCFRIAYITVNSSAAVYSQSNCECPHVKPAHQDI